MYNVGALIHHHQVDEELAFLDGFVQTALNNGAKPYVPGWKGRTVVMYQCIVLVPLFRLSIGL